MPREVKIWDFIASFTCSLWKRGNYISSLSLKILICRIKIIIVPSPIIPWEINVCIAQNIVHSISSTNALTILSNGKLREVCERTGKKKKNMRTASKLRMSDGIKEGKDKRLWSEKEISEPEHMQAKQFWWGGSQTRQVGSFQKMAATRAEALEKLGRKYEDSPRGAASEWVMKKTERGARQHMKPLMARENLYVVYRWQDEE